MCKKKNTEDENSRRYILNLTKFIGTANILWSTHLDRQLQRVLGPKSRLCTKKLEICYGCPTWDSLARGGFPFMAQDYFSVLSSLSRVSWGEFVLCALVLLLFSTGSVASWTSWEHDIHGVSFIRSTVTLSQRPDQCLWSIISLVCYQPGLRARPVVLLAGSYLSLESVERAPNSRIESK